MRRDLFYAVDHQGKGRAYIQALLDAGWGQAHRLDQSGIRFILSDADWHVPVNEAAAKRSLPMFLYPHAARPMVQYDCPNLDPEPVAAMFVSAPAGVELMKRIGYPYPVEMVGWSLSGIRPFQPHPEVKRVTFAPIHPNGNGWLSKIDQHLNREVYGRLHEWCKANGAELTVRYVRKIEQNGLEAEMAKRHTGVTWIEGRPNGSTVQIQSADLVVAHQTYAYIAVALGVPTLMMGEDKPPRTGNSEESFSLAEHFEDYADYLRFPLDILAEDDDSDLIRRATQSDAEIRDWKERFIGKPFDGAEFVKKLEAYL